MHGVKAGSTRLRNVRRDIPVLNNEGWNAQLTLSLQRLLLGLAQHLLPAGVTPAYFADLAAHAFVDAAANISRCRNGRVNSSRIAVLTSLRRAEIRRLLRSSDSVQQVSRVCRPRTELVIDGWRTDPKYLNCRGLPRQLRMSGKQCSFAALVRAFAGDVPPTAVLQELRRLNAVRENAGYIELISHRRLNSSARGSLQGLMQILLDGLDASNEAADSNLRPRLQKVSVSAAHTLDLEMMSHRAWTSANAFLEGLRCALPNITTPPRRAKKMSHRLTVTVLVTPRHHRMRSNK